MEGILKITKLRLERDKKKGEKVRFSRIRGCMTVVGYIFIVLFIMTLCTPPIVMNYVRTQIREGEWVNTDPVVVETADDSKEATDKFDKSEEDVTQTDEKLKKD